MPRGQGNRLVAASLRWYVARCIINDGVQPSMHFNEQLIPALGAIA